MEFDLKKYLAEFSADEDVEHLAASIMQEGGMAEGMVQYILRAMQIGVEVLKKRYTSEEMNSLSLWILSRGTEMYMDSEGLSPDKNLKEYMGFLMSLIPMHDLMKKHVWTAMTLMIGIAVQEELLHGGRNLDIDVPDL